MSFRALARLLGAYVLVLAIACVVVRDRFTIYIRDSDAAGVVVATVWLEGKPIASTIEKGTNDTAPKPDLLFESAAATPGAMIGRETILGHAPILTFSELVMAMSIVAGMDGVRATLPSGRAAYVTPDELLARQGYDKNNPLPELSLSIGTDVPLVLALLSEKLGVTVPELRDKAKFERVRFRRTTHHGDERAPPSEPTADSLRAEDVRSAAIDAARYLARGVRPDGRFRYMVDAPTNRTLGGYDWPRHAGATYFIAQAANLSKDPELVAAARRAASLVRDSALVPCGASRCVGDDDITDVGSSALALVAIVEIVRGGIDESFRPLVVELASFLKKQQRADGEFMHQFDRTTGSPIDVQFLYYSGEATLALARAHTITGDPKDLHAASRGLARIVGPAWSFFGDRYYFGEEHWTCQATDDLWERAPDLKALDFCVRWNAFSRAMQIGPGDTPWGADVDGAFGVAPVVTPRLTPVGSRCEAAVATMNAARKAKLPQKEIHLLDRQLRRSLALLLRHQFRPGATHLFADPAAVHGGMPGSPVDWQLRIDYAQHAGSAMIRWLDVASSSAR